ncbi:hypothetical protein diail_7696 [Diaporthe ilicicola]|nr:hypothetical protein diail_7696 [Diaporthe ilicicola]
MSVEERAELERLRQLQQRQEVPTEVPSKTRDRGGDIQDLVYRLRTLPEDEAVALLLQVRSGARVNSNLITARDIPPPSRTSLEFELMHRHPLLYTVFTTVDTPGIQVSALKRLPGQDGGPVAAGSKMPSSRGPSSSHQPSPTKVAFPALRSRSFPDPSAAPALPDLCDERLRSIKISNWTQVPVSNELAAQLLSFYLTVDHPILGLFDADLFIGDLVAQKTEFCCPLLLSAVLCFACQGYSSIEPDTTGLSYAFFKEAQLLHEEESNNNPQYQFVIPNIAATQLLSLAAAFHGRNELARRYLLEGIHLAHQNGLLAVGKKQSARNWLDDNVDFLKAASHTAWGTFCRATVLGMNYQITYIDIPSWLPVPGTVIVRSDGRSEPFGLPAYMGQSFTQLCRLTPLINEMLNDYYDCGDGVAPRTRASFSVAQGLYKRLLKWADSLPVTMARGDDMPHHVAILHIFFHTAVLDLFRPFPYQQPPTPFMLDHCEAEDATPEAVCNASVNQLKHLILVFQSLYPPATVSMLWQNALIYVANACLPLRRSPLQPMPGSSAEEDGGGVFGLMEGVSGGGEQEQDGEQEDGEEDDEEEEEESEEDAQRRKWFMACIDALGALAPQFGIVTGIVQGILSMAILKGSVAAADGRAIMERLKADTEVSRRYRREALAQGQGQGLGGGGRAEDDGAELVSSVIYGSGGGHQSGHARNGRPTPGLVNIAGAQRGDSGFVIDLNEASVNPSAASLDVLARAFDELAVFDEFTNVEEE